MSFDITAAAALVRRHPLVTNPHIRMCAVITEVLHLFGQQGAEVLREAYTDLGHRTGAFMIAGQVVPPGANLETWGRVSEEIMDTCGLEGWTRVPTDNTQHRVKVPGCAAYVDVYRQIGAPAELCAIPFAWDNGCLDIVNPNLRINPEMCVYTGDVECHYVIRRATNHRNPAGAAGESPHQTMEAQKPGAVAVADAPAWTNPFAGLLAVCSRSLERLYPSPRGPLEKSLTALGTITGHYLRDHDLTGNSAGPHEIARLAAGIAVASGYGSVRLDTGDPRAVVLRHDDPFGPVLETFGPAQEVRELTSVWDDAWVNTVAPSLTVSTVWDVEQACVSRTFCMPLQHPAPLT